MTAVYIVGLYIVHYTKVVDWRVCIAFAMRFTVIMLGGLYVVA